MQLADLSELMQLGKPGPQAAAAGSPPAPLDAAQPEPKLSEGPAAATPAPEQVSTAVAVADISCTQIEIVPPSSEAFLDHSSVVAQCAVQPVSRC
jgi:hypothetical protein